MADASQDPRDTPHHPRRRETLYGHGAAEARLMAAAHTGKLHHAWLLTGPEGIGKATLAYRFARHLLSTGPTPTAARQIAAGSHPGLLVLERAFDAKNKRLKTEISVEDARAASTFFAHTAGAGGWRICIVDEAGDLNKESANALLKIVEEPPEQALFLIVSHRAGAVLPTIRSRCMHLPLKPLTLDDTVRVLREVDRSPDAQQQEAAELSGGSPGRALQLLDSKGAKAFAAFRKLPKLTLAACVDLGSHFAHRDSGADLAVFGELLTAWIAEEARRRGLQGGGAKLAKVQGEIVASLRRTDALNLDRRQTAVDALLLLDAALKAS